MADDSSASTSSSGLNGSFDEASGFPDDFPHASRLKKAGVDSLSDLREVDALENLSGIGPSYAEEIEEALEQLDAPATGSDGGATTEKRPSPLSGDGAAEEAPEGPWTQQSIDIPEGPIEETVSFDISARYIPQDFSGAFGRLGDLWMKQPGSRSLFKPFTYIRSIEMKYRLFSNNKL
ncbi:MAG: hypothetical protein R6T83_01495, partial [Salinibacter sp.]